MALFVCFVNKIVIKKKLQSAKFGLKIDVNNCEQFVLDRINEMC